MQYKMSNGKRLEVHKWGVNMNTQQMFDKYKKEVCNYCINNNQEDCNICIKRNLTVICENYIKDKSKFKKRHKVEEW